MSDGPVPDRSFTMPKSFKELLAKVVSKNPKGKPLTADGQFIPDPTPVAPPIGYQPEQNMFDRMRDLVRRELSAAAADRGHESFEEADDFDVGDDYEPFSEYELIVEQAQPDGPVVNPDPDQAKPTETPPTAAGGTEGGDQGGSPKSAPPEPAPGSQAPKK